MVGKVWFLVRYDEGVTYKYGIVKYENHPAPEAGNELLGGIVVMQYGTKECILIEQMVKNKSIDSVEMLINDSAQSIIESSLYAKAINAMI